jgi:hypothetical protein
VRGLVILEKKIPVQLGSMTGGKIRHRSREANVERRVALILCTGIDPGLLETRRIILERAGHTVIMATDERELVAACEANPFDVAVIGQTVSPRMKRAIASLIRKRCRSARILELYPLYQGKALEDADSWLEVPAEIPHELAERVNQLVKDRYGDGA